MEPVKKVDVLSETSDRTGIPGLLERFLRRFRQFGFVVIILPVGFLAAFCMGTALAPALYLYHLIDSWSADFSLPLRYLSLGVSFGLGFFVYAVALIFVVPIVNFLVPLKVKPFRGNWFSFESYPWYIHNALTYIVRYTCLELLTPSPFTVFFYKMMGMKVGKGVVINTTNISDPCLITLEDYVTVGGSAHIFAHYGQKGFLIVDRVHVKKGTTIGLKASIMGDVVVGENCIIRPHTCLLPKTRVPDGETV